MKKVAIQGIKGSFHDIATRKFFGEEEVELVCCDTFEDLFDVMKKDPALLGMVAIENTIAGSLLHNYELLRASQLTIIGEKKLHIEHSLLCLPEETEADICEINSHPVALMQCRGFLKQYADCKIVGELEEGSMVLRAKIDMSHNNMLFRDPIIYRIVKTPHHRTGDKWKAYPMYDFAHGQSDFFEGVTHSLCTLEFVPHRPLYDLFIDWLKKGEDLDDNRPKQREFNKLNLNYTLLSKRNLLALVQNKMVDGWDDPRMPTICGYRRRGYTPEAIKLFVDKIGYTLYDALNDMALMESACREDLNRRATRVSAVIDPVKLIVTNYPEDKTELLDAINNPEDPEAGTHQITFSRELWIEREDFMEDAPKKYFRLTPGQEVRLKNAYIVLCTGCKKDAEGRVEEIYCEYIPNTKTGESESNRRVRGTIHWVSIAHAIQAEVRLYDRLWLVENPRDELARLRETGLEVVDAMKQMMNPNSLEVRPCCYVEEFLANAQPLEHFQFQRIGYFCADKSSTSDHLVFNRTVSLKDSFKPKG